MCELAPNLPGLKVRLPCPSVPPPLPQRLSIASELVANPSVSARQLLLLHSLLAWAPPVPCMCTVGQPLHTPIRCLNALLPPLHPPACR